MIRPLRTLTLAAWASSAFALAGSFAACTSSDEPSANATLQFLTLSDRGALYLRIYDGSEPECAGPALSKSAANASTLQITLDTLRLEDLRAGMELDSQAAFFDIGEDTLDFLTADVSIGKVTASRVSGSVQSLFGGFIILRDRVRFNAIRCPDFGTALPDSLTGPDALTQAGLAE